MPKSFETVTRELTELLSGAAEVLSGDMMHLAVRRADRVSVLRYTPFGGCRETTAEDYIQDMDALEKVYSSGSMTLRKDGTARAFGKSDVYGQLQIADASLWRQAVKIVRDQAKILGLLPDGTAIAYGYGRYGQTSVFHWRDLADIACGDEWATGKLASGQLIGTPEWKGRMSDRDGGAVSFEDAFVWHGDREPWSCPRRDNYPGGEPHPGDLPEDIRWADLRQLVPGENLTVGVRRDGTLVATGLSNFVVSLGERFLPDWRDIRSLQIVRLDRSFAENTLLVGLTHDGQVRACALWGGDLAAPFPAHICCPSSVVQVLGGTMDERPYLALLGQDGRVYLEGAPGPALQELGSWRGIRALTARWQDIRRLWYTMGHLVGQRADGTLLLSREKSY